VAGLSGCRRPPHPSCLVKHNSILLPTNAVKFYIIIFYLCLLCCPHDGSALSALLGKWVCRHPIASSSRTSLDSRLNSWGSVSDLDACVGFRGSKKVEKHWSTLTTLGQLVVTYVCFCHWALFFAFFLFFGLFFCVVSTWCMNGDVWLIIIDVK